MIEILKHNFKNRSSGFNIINPIVGGALVTGGTQLLGGLLSGIGEDADSKRAERLALMKSNEQSRQFGQTLAQNNSQFNQTLEQREDEFGRTAGMQGLNFLAQQRGQSAQKARTANFRDALISASRGQ